MKYIFLILAVALSTVSCSSQNKIVLEPTAFNDSIHSSKNAIVLDVRTPGEYSKGFIANAKNVDIRDDEFKTVIDKMDKNQTYYVYCLSGGRSSSAIDYMEKSGFKHLYELKGGIMGWKREKMLVTEVGEVADKISFEEYESMISNGKVLIDFYAPWCGPCIQMEGMIKKISSDYEGKIKIVRINIDDNKSLSNKLGVMEIPYFKLYNDKVAVWDHTGLISEKELTKALK